MTFSRVTHDLADPDFPHGTEAGYARGCTSREACPAAPNTCRDATAGSEARRRAQRALDTAGPDDGKQAFYVRRRIEETLTRIDLDQLATEADVPAERITEIRGARNVWLPEAEADALDRVWSIHKYGFDPLTVPPEAHGQQTTYAWGCRCRPCQAGQAKAGVMRQVGILAENSHVPSTPELVAKVKRAVEVYGSPKAVEMHAGIYRASMNRILSGGRIQYRVAQRVLALDLDKAAREFRNDWELVPIAPTLDVIGKLMAQGYPQKWLFRRIGMAGTTIKRDAVSVTIRTQERMEKLFKELADVPATPEGTGQPQHQISRAKNSAAAAGYYPAVCYDDQGNLDVRALPTHPWSVADSNAAATLDALAARLDGATWERAEEVSGVGYQSIKRACTNAGLIWDTKVTTDRAVNVTLRPESYEAASRVRVALRAYEDGMWGPVRALLEAGFERPMPSGPGAQKRIPADHPEWVEFLAAQQQEQAA